MPAAWGRRLSKQPTRAVAVASLRSAPAGPDISGPYDGGSSVAGNPGARSSVPTASSSKRTTIGDQAEPP